MAKNNTNTQEQYQKALAEAREALSKYYAYDDYEIPSGVVEDLLTALDAAQPLVAEKDAILKVLQLFEENLKQLWGKTETPYAEAYGWLRAQAQYMDISNFKPSRSEATSVDAWKPSEKDYDRSIHCNPDAKAWADLFVETYPGLADKHDLMLGWFSNAMMAMHDHIKVSPAPVAVPAGYTLVPVEPLIRARNTAMEWTLRGRIPECGEFGGIAQDLDAVLYSANNKGDSVERDRMLYGESFELNGVRIPPENVVAHTKHTKDAVCTCPSGDGSLRWPCPQHPPEKATNRVQFDTAVERWARARGADALKPPTSQSETVWREGWAYAYSGFAKLYCKDGELQDNSTHPFIDWRRDSAETIRNKIIERAKRTLGHTHE